MTWEKTTPRGDKISCGKGEPHRQVGKEWSKEIKKKIERWAERRRGV